MMSPKSKLLLIGLLILATCEYIQLFFKTKPCYSPFQAVRKYNIISILASPFLILDVESIVVDLLSLVPLLGYFWKYNIPINKSNLLFFLGLTYITFLIISLVSSYVLFYIIQSHSIWVSHLFHDCSAGFFHLTLPTITFLLSKKDYKFSISSITFFTSSFCLTLLNIRFHTENSLSVILSLICGNLVLFWQERRLNLDHNANREKNLNYKIEFFELNHKKTIHLRFYILLMVIVATFLVRNFTIQESTIFLEKQGNQLPILTIVIPTVSRKSNPRYLSATLESILDQLPHIPSNPFYNGHIQIYAISFDSSENLVFNGIKKIMELNDISKNYVSFVYESEIVVNRSYTDDNHKLRAHVSASLQFAYEKSPSSTWIMIQEDDFQLCPNKWSWFMHTLTKISNQEEPGYCAFFVATGGSGIVIRRNIVPSVIIALLDNQLEEPADVIMQNCLRGLYTSHCTACSLSQTPSMLISSHIIFRHIGFISSLNHKYVENEARWACGWSHPFNGDPDVNIVHTDVFL